MAARKPMRTTVSGTGLIALDVVYGLAAEAPRFFAGGTCGNVLAILGYLGWTARAVGRLGSDLAGRRIEDDLRRWNVNTDLLRLVPADSPIIIQRIRADRDGVPYHTFSWTCPQCGHRLPGYSPVTAKAAQEVADAAPASNVFFFDRASRGALVLAEAQMKKGAVVVFEPSAVGQRRPFLDAMRIAHVVKYSQERRKGFEEWLKAGRPLLTIETLGRGGLRYRSRLDAKSRTRWHHMSAVRATDLRDAAGAGDWLMAGVIHELCASGLDSLRKKTADEVEQALAFGQALASWNCAYEGARAGMYHITKTGLMRIVSELLQGDGSPSLESQDDSLPSVDRICGSCDEAPTHKRSRKAGGRKRPPASQPRR